MGRLRQLIAIAVLVAAVGVAGLSRWPWAGLDLAPPIVVGTAFQESSDTLKDGETLGNLFLRRGLAPLDLPGLFQQSGLDPRRLRAGLVVLFRIPVGDALPIRVTMRTSPEERLTASRESGAWTAVRKTVAWTSELIRIEGAIESSLYDALDAVIPDSLFDAGNRIRLAWDLADVYAWSIDFNRDIQTGDRFAVLVTREVSEEGEVRTGDIRAADLLVSGKHQGAYRFGEAGTSARYYDSDGHSLRRAFLRAPVEFRRISSSFSRARLHPILGIWRRHQGTDYAASSGTPVLASGDGTVLRAGWTGGYGNLIELRHRNGVTTRYGHLRAFARGIHSGTRVSQGEVIGYVGATGLASAPHLHYEFRINGLARDPRRVDLGEGEPLARSLLPDFLRERERLGLVLGQAGQGAALTRAE